MNIFDKFRKPKSPKAQPDEAGHIAVELSQLDQTLIIGRSFSACGSCKGNADPYEVSHEMKLMEGIGCGATWLFVSTDVAGQDYSHLRPDLIPVTQDMTQDGLSTEIEKSVIGDWLDS